MALSGGGFRASFFHIGVLAQMAMLGLLRPVEVISTVSGGSIIGALYYLHVKKLLETKPDDDITEKDYNDIVERLEEDFLRAVQRNIRMRTFLNPLKNLRMSRANYSRSDRIGELYDEILYRPVVDPSRPTPLEMRDLKIRPKGAKPGFYPLTDNAPRRAKVPILLLNATTLNTGRNWRFEASRMGEPEEVGVIAGDVDKNVRLRRPPSYEAITPEQQDIELGLAVAASACVPAIFHPLAISNLYPEGIRVQLVDGGVHDNQGIQGLQDMGCAAFVVSDASGQMEEEADPPAGLLPVLGRTNSILMDRVRSEELFRLLEASPRQAAFMHLRKGLPVKTVPWIGPNGRPVGQTSEEPAKEPSEQFGVAQQVQHLLSRIRTDLDSFTDVEAYSLMLDGYRMSERYLPGAPGVKALFSEARTAVSPRWRFLHIAPWMERPTPAYLRQLAVASRQALKVFRLRPVVTAVTLLVAVGIVGGLCWLFWNQVRVTLSLSFSLGQLFVAAVILALGFIPWISRTLGMLRFLRSPGDFLVRVLIRGLPPALASVFVWIHLRIFDPLFLRQGRLERLGPPPHA